jgi:hypothetical protein
MQPRIRRTLVAAASCAGLVMGGAMSAAASSGYDGHGKKHRGWVKVCQDVKKYGDYKDDKGKDDKDNYEGRYQVKDSYGSVWKFNLKGKYDCKQVKVRAGKVSVKVLYKPKDTDLKGYEDRYLRVKKDAYEKVTYEYKAVAYGWVKVCQDIKKKDDDKGKDDKGKDDNEYRGTYEVKDSYGNTSKVYLEGKYDCDEVKVRAGKVDVKVIYQPEDTKLKGDEKVYVDVDKDEYEKVTFEYRAKDDDHGDYGLAGHAAA